MKIPVEHFNNTPVYALCPNKPQESNVSGASSNVDEVAQPATATLASKKNSLPGSLGLLEAKSVGSAPSSPSASRKLEGIDAAEEAKEDKGINTISAGVGLEGQKGDFGPISLPMGSSNRIAKYATLPKKYSINFEHIFGSFLLKVFFSRFRNRRMSLMSSKEKERLEGSLLTVCSDCKDMVVQVSSIFIVIKY